MPVQDLSLFFVRFINTVVTRSKVAIRKVLAVAQPQSGGREDTQHIQDCPRKYSVKTKIFSQTATSNVFTSPTRSWAVI